MKTFTTILLVLLISAAALAQIPRTLSYQGILTDSTGAVKPDGNYSFTFKLYDATTEIWEETKTLQVKNGLFSTSLGDATPFGASVKFDKPYLLGIKVGSEQELTPRIPLTSVAYSLNTSLEDTMWVKNGSDLYFLNGNVGIGTTNPVTKLQVEGGDLKLGGARLHTDEPAEFFWTVNGNDYRWRDSSVTFYANSYKLEHDGSGDLLINKLNGGNVIISTIGKVGIGTTTPSEKFEVVGGKVVVRASGPAQLFLNNGLRLGSVDGAYTWIQGYGGPLILNPIGGYVGINCIPTANLDVNGLTKIEVLEITGGSDLAEPFEILDNETLVPGSVVIIDENNPGKLKLSSQPYDKRVAGVVSGAGGIQPGITLKQEGLMEGKQNVALSGRVYVLATTENGAITPGDLLTTSSLGGYVMKATDKERWDGCVIGKAMSSLNEGEGLVLVLINLQ